MHTKLNKHSALEEVRISFWFWGGKPLQCSVCKMFTLKQHQWVQFLIASCVAVIKSLVVNIKQQVRKGNYQQDREMCHNKAEHFILYFVCFFFNPVCVCSVLFLPLRGFILKHKSGIRLWLFQREKLTQIKLFFYFLSSLFHSLLFLKCLRSEINIFTSLFLLYFLPYYAQQF